MARERKGCRNLAILGCVGCLGLIVVVLVGVAIVLGMAWSEVRDEQIERRQQQVAIRPATGVCRALSLEPHLGVRPGSRRDLGSDLPSALIQSH